MKETIDIESKLLKQLRSEAEKQDLTLSEYLEEKYLFTDIVPVFFEENQKWYLRADGKNTEITKGEKKLIAALNDVAITIVHAPKKIEEWKRN